MAIDPTPATTDATTTDTTDEQARPVGALRLLPSVMFGSKVAALSRAALPIGMMATGIAAAWPTHGGNVSMLMDTTCCPIGNA